MGRLRVVLVEPREGGNVGAVARAMKNFGFEDLFIAGAVPALQPVAEWWASGAEDVLGAARQVDSLESALAEAHLTIATTSSRERNFTPDLTPEGVAQQFHLLAEDQILALVFGREDRGLTSRELALCQRSASIATSPEFPTMNLAQSVGIFCYEASRVSPLRRGPPPRDLADGQTLERLHRRAQDLLTMVGFLHENNPERIYDDLRAIAGRAVIDQREATILLGIIRQIEWKLGIR